MRRQARVGRKSLGVVSVKGFSLVSELLVFGLFERSGVAVEGVE